MHIEVLSEDKSGSVVLQSILSKFIEQRDLNYSFDIRPHRGKGRIPDDFNKKPAKYASGLLDLLPAKIKAYASVYKPYELILVVVMDSDEEPFDHVYSRLERIIQKFGRKIPYVIGISVEEMESWLLGDTKAIVEAYPHARVAVINNYEQDSVCGTWEVLARTIYGNDAERLIRIGYPAVGQYKYEWASRISPLMDLDKNQSPSFQRFIKQLKRIVEKQEEKTRSIVNG